MSQKKIYSTQGKKEFEEGEIDFLSNIDEEDTASHNYLKLRKEKNI